MRDRNVAGLTSDLAPERLLAYRIGNTPAAPLQDLFSE
jgi:hypothetical protein